MITIPSHVEQQVMHLAQQQQIAPENVLERAMQSFVDDLDDKADIEAADKAKARLLTGESVRLSMNDAMRLLDELVN